MNKTEIRIFINTRITYIGKYILLKPSGNNIYYQLTTTHVYKQLFL